jgi:hypothetical protein
MGYSGIQTESDYLEVIDAYLGSNKWWSGTFTVFAECVTLLRHRKSRVYASPSKS